ncbi:MAG TPA: phosphoribosylformylglycinamidine synthase subunit PurL [bacterium]|nr:phosphoribosylformylglycinamidine synthase subunit PurL [bacterium]
MRTREELERISMSLEEYELARSYLGREPNDLELGMIAVMWSEHCGYKHSKKTLKLFPTSGENVLQGPGENAGIIRLDEELALAMKMESHNHPSAIEPYQGAATGVGGIVRDILAMGARPVALLDSLRFGTLDNPRTRYLFSGVVSGISGYGNCIGVPTIGGELAFEKPYTENPLVNVTCLGLLKGKPKSGKAEGTGNSLILVGASTGRDGIHGATFASLELTSSSIERRPAVQAGDPFMEKLLIEAVLEALEKSDAIIGVQDMGAAGITSSSVEMANRGGVGVEIEVTKVPQREKGMTPEEIMLSESQERMLLCVERGKEEGLRPIFEKWGLNFAIIGQVIPEKMVRIKENGNIVGEIPVDILTEMVPAYDLETKIPENLNRLQTVDSIPEIEDYGDVLLRLLNSPNCSTSKWVYEQYDHMVETNTVSIGTGASIIRVKGKKFLIGVTTDGEGRYCYLDPYIGGIMIVAESARNLICIGAEPLAITDGLNFGNPEDPEVAWYFVETVKGMSECARKLNIPVVGGNVSFYNESENYTVYPTPIVGMVGKIENLETLCTPQFKNEGDVIYILGEPGNLGGTLFIEELTGEAKGKPEIDLELEVKLQRLLLKAIREKLIKSAQDVSRGGLAIALAECSIWGNMGIDISIESEKSPEEVLFGEAQPVVIITTDANRERYVEEYFKEVPIRKVGRVIKDRFKISFNRNSIVDLEISLLKNKWNSGIERWMI